MEKIRFCTLPLELIEDGNKTAVISLLNNTISFCILDNETPENDFNISASDIIAWNRKTGIECR